MDKLDEFIISNELLSLYKPCDVDWCSVYHYTSPDGMLGILQPGGRAKLWFTRYDSLNDINERKEIISFLEGYCAYQVKNKKLSQEFAEAILQLKPSDEHLLTYPMKPVEVEGAFSEATLKTNSRIAECDTYLCCFSDNPDLLPMWNYYTKSQHYEGYSIGFNCPFLAGNAGFEKGYSLEFKRVVYSDYEKTALLDKLLLPSDEFYRISSEDNKVKLLSVIQDFLNDYQFAFKNSAFRHEREIRAILRIPRKPILGGQGFEVKYRNSNGYIVPYVEFETLPNVVEKITISPLLQPEISQRNIREMLKRRGYYCVDVETSTVPVRF